MVHHDVDIQWGNHDVVWMGRCRRQSHLHPDGAPDHGGLQQPGHAGKTATASACGSWTTWPRNSTAAPMWSTGNPTSIPAPTPGADTIARAARMHKAVTVLMAQAGGAGHRPQPGFPVSGPGLPEPDQLRRRAPSAAAAGCVSAAGPGVPHRGPGRPHRPHPPGRAGAGGFWSAPSPRASACSATPSSCTPRVRSTRCSTGNLLFHGAVPMTEEGDFAAETFEGKSLCRQGTV